VQADNIACRPRESAENSALIDDCDAVCRRALGWLHIERGIPVAELSLSKLFPSAEREGVAVVFDYLQWLSARGISPATEGKAQFPAVAGSYWDTPHGCHAKGARMHS